MRTAKISELFFSVQGEGAFIGYPQVFIRFAGCNLSCRYCDLPKNLSAEELPAPKLVNRILNIIKENGSAHSVSLTGGEPLLQADFLTEFLPLMKQKKIPVYLETNGTFPEELKRIGRYLNFIAMDLKISSATEQAAPWHAHRYFLQECQRYLPSQTCVKVVVTEKTGSGEIDYAAKLVRKINSKTPLIIQPALDRSGRPEVSGQKLIHLFQSAFKILPTARLIPPMHQFLRLP
ncbi:MAG: 7-carboxy-7-deazaguanine synthase QueE [Candidatus Omnitrophica bacterium]|nr:7-carboxy-7-deazaguanine synthase QueE [Candidatus Omnitrophota bacterium]